MSQKKGLDMFGFCQSTGLFFLVAEFANFVTSTEITLASVTSSASKLKIGRDLSEK
jgi:hypothetical protein